LAVGYSEAHIARLENGQRAPNPVVVRADFVAALHVDEEPAWVARLIALAEQHGAPKPHPPESTATRPPALASASAAPSNLRAQLTPLTGRQDELAEVKRILATTRLLTLVGAPGVGKSRLGAEVAADVLPLYKDGVFVVALALIATPEQLIPHSARALQMPDPDRAGLAELRAFLRERELLLVFDNAEHLIRPCADLVVRLLQTCPRLAVLLTSREELNVPSETVWRVPPLKCADVAALFVDWARASHPDLPENLSHDPRMVVLCEQLDGLPLAVELAASRLRVLTFDQIIERLDDRFNLLAGGNRVALPKHQSLQAAFDWSYGLLTEDERRLFRRLAVFERSFSLDDAEAVCVDDALPKAQVLQLLDHLARKSLVERINAGAVSCYSLLGTLRQYAHNHLVEADEYDAVARRMTQL
jgi:predicted ATPase